MKLSVQTSVLSSSLSTLSKSYHEDSIWILASRDSLVLTVDDLEARWSLSMPANVETPGQIHTSIKRLSAYLPRVAGPPDAEFKLLLTPKSLLVESGTAKGHLPIMDSSLFPAGRALDKDTTKTSKFERGSFQAAVASCLPVVRATTGTGYTTGIYVTTTPLEGFALATDGKQVIRRKFRCEGGEVSFTVEAQQLHRAASQEGDTVICMADQRTSRFKNDRFIADLAQYSNNPPDVAGKFLGDLRAYPHQAEIPTAMLIEALQICDSVGGTRDKFRVYMDLGQTGCSIRANGDQLDEVRVDVMGTSTRDIQIYVNYNALIKALNTFVKLGMVKDTVVLKFDHERSPFFVQLEDPEEFYVLSAVSPPALESGAP